MKLNSVLCLLLLASNTQAAFWNKNGNNNEDGGANRRRLTEVRAAAMDADAATGTVKKVVTADEKAAQTCDGQMALSLANANEAKIMAEVERDEIKNQKTLALEQVAALEKSLGEMASIKRELEAKVDEVTREKDAKVKSIMDSLKSSTGDLVKEYEAKIGELTKKHADEMASLNSQLESSNESSSAKIQELEKKIVEDAKAAEEASAEALKNLEYFHSQELAMFKNQMAVQEVEAADALAKQEEAAQAKLKEALAEKNKSIKAAKAHAKKAEQDAKESEEELAMWRATHQNRSYCNYTYMTEDIYWVKGVAYNKSASLTWNAYEGATSLASKATTKSYDAYEASKVYTDQGHKAFERNVKPHYDKHVKPHYDKHVSPIVAKGYEAYEKQVLPKLKETKSKIDPKIVQFWEAYEKQFNKLARKYATACDKAFQASSKMARKNNLKAFDDYIAPSWKASCDHPKQTLRGAQIAVMVALLLPYTFTFIRFALWLVFLPFRIIIRLVLLPLSIFISSKPKKTPSKKTVGDVKVKPKKKTRITNTSQ